MNFVASFLNWGRNQEPIQARPMSRTERQWRRCKSHPLVAALIAGGASVQTLGSSLVVLVDQADELGPLFFSAGGYAMMGGVLQNTGLAFLPWFALPAFAVLLSIIGQRGFTVTTSKIEPKLSRISMVSNAKNKFGRNGLFEFFKSFVKLAIRDLLDGGKAEQEFAAVSPGRANDTPLVACKSHEAGSNSPERLTNAR